LEKAKDCRSVSLLRQHLHIWQDSGDCCVKRELGKAQEHMIDRTNYLKPYGSPFDDSSYLISRVSLDGVNVVGVFKAANGGWGRTFGNGTRYLTKEAAIAALDNDLIERGYVLLTEEQFEKLSVLL
jgi:hypothetical protein